jgi:hypothetical protein
MDARKNDVLTLTNTNGAISHSADDGRTVAAIFIGHLLFPCIHIHSTNAHTIKVWATNESDPVDESNAVQIGEDIVADAIVVIESGPTHIFIEVDAAGTGTPTAIVTGRVV